jgi:hypothetical protein
MSEQHHQEIRADSGRSLDRVRQARVLKHAARQESWLEQLQRIADAAKGKPQSGG